MLHLPRDTTLILEDSAFQRTEKGEELVTKRHEIGKPEDPRHLSQILDLPRFTQIDISPLHYFRRSEDLRVRELQETYKGESLKVVHFIPGGESKVSDYQTPLYTFGNFGCSSLVLTHEATQQQLLLHAHTKMTPNDIRELIKEFPVQDARIYLLPGIGKNAALTTNNILRALNSLSPGSGHRAEHITVSAFSYNDLITLFDRVSSPGISEAEARSIELNAVRGFGLRSGLVVHQGTPYLLPDDVPLPR